MFIRMHRGVSKQADCVHLSKGVKGLELDSTSIDHTNNVINSDRGLGDVGRQDNLTHTRGRAKSVKGREGGKKVNEEGTHVR